MTWVTERLNTCCVGNFGTTQFVCFTDVNVNRLLMYNRHVSVQQLQWTGAYCVGPTTGCMACFIYIIIFLN